MLDASALLAVLHDETGKEQVIQQMSNAAICSVNYAEVVTKLANSGMPKEIIQASLHFFPIDIVNFDIEMAILAGEMIKETRSLGLSLGDRACLAAGKILNLPILTADKVWLKVELDIDIYCIR
ncbi:type II toxin-antitoxin system VapC family toxin [Candidatus Albibeggiatoa sp. nov. NOAA]|uniref:type II toxin-antitoxin system VapC family toxin n=1 Tax=Candidatus Albibeggiatoa sp. nov. NOAA TaxID=3162724 RepID=UPI0032F1B167|nr:type II toxin-antitoxin system VapC family toxin [Thiotrichaceae bacterium]